MGLLNKAKEKILGKKEETLIDILKSKGIESPVFEKIYDFNFKKFSQKDVDSKHERIRELRAELDKIDEKYVNSGYDEKVLKQASKIKAEIQELQDIAQSQQRILSKNPRGQRLELTNDDKQSIVEAIAPLKTKRDDVLEDCLEKFSTFKDSLEKLDYEQQNLIEIFRNIAAIANSNLGNDSGIWLFNLLTEFPHKEINQELVELQAKTIDDGFQAFSILLMS